MGSMSSISVSLFLLISAFYLSIVTACSDHHPPPPPSPPKPLGSPPPPSPPPPPRSPPPSSRPPTASSPHGKCPRGTLKLGVCADILGLASLSVGAPRDGPCCKHIKGLIDLDAAVCLCTAIKAHVLHVISLDVEASLNLILNTCGKRVPSGFQCTY